MQFLRQKISAHFNKLTLIFLFVFMVGICIHLMHKQDAGTDESNFITWATNTATFILGKLTTVIFADEKIPAEIPAEAEAAKA